MYINANYFGARNTQATMQHMQHMHILDVDSMAYDVGNILHNLFGINVVVNSFKYILQLNLCSLVHLSDANENIQVYSRSASHMVHRGH